MTGGGRSVSLSSPAVRITVTRRVPPDVPAATYARTSTCGNHTPYVWLTFDDYGSAAHVTSILSTLRRNHVQAMLFPIGIWARAHPSLISAMKRDGQTIDNHTATHADLSTASDATVLWQIDHGASPPRRCGCYGRRTGQAPSPRG